MFLRAKKSVIILVTLGMMNPLNSATEVTSALRKPRCEGTPISEIFRGKRPGVTGHGVSQLTDSAFAWFHARFYPKSKFMPGSDWLASHVARDTDQKIYRLKKNDFEDALKKLPKKEADALRDLFESLRFIDYAHMAAHLIETFRDPDASISDLELQKIYDSDKPDGGHAFANTRDAKKWISQNPKETHLKKLIEAHRRAMAGGIDKLPEVALGAVRGCRLWGVAQEEGITYYQLQTIQENIYLGFEETRRTKNRVHGDIVYPSAATVSPEALDRIRSRESKLVEAIEAYQSQVSKAKALNPDHDPGEAPLLTKKLLNALFEERAAHYQAQVYKLGERNTLEAVKAYVALVSDFFVDAISIHALEDGNGRTNRITILYDQLNAAGISKPRLVNPDLDYLVPRQAWLDQLWRGILNTNRLYSDMRLRIELGLRVENSPELIYPDPPRNIRLHHRYERRKKILKNEHFALVDPKQFAVYVDTRMRINPQLRHALERTPLEFMARMRREYKVFAKETQYVWERLQGPRSGTLERVALYLVDRDFMDSFGVTYAHDKNKWDYKVKNWYLPELLWRGLSYETLPPLEELLSLFRELGDHMVSQRVLSKENSRTTPERRAILAREDFLRYNRAVLEQTFWEMAQHHADAVDPFYTYTPGYSMSRRWVIARSFAMGAMLIEDTMFKDYRKRQDLVGGRVVVGAFRARKDVDLSRLKVIDDRFSYKYPRQAEVMGIGGTDPDSVMVVQVINPRGHVDLSLVRNPEKPSEVWILKGDFNAFESKTPPADKLIRTTSF
jgi:hypothetical protein